MATQLLIYERAVPVSQQRHRDWYIKTGTDYGFAGKVNSVLLVGAEVTVAAQSYPIVFAGEADLVPVVLLGVRVGENLFVDAKGKSRSRRNTPSGCTPGCGWRCSRPTRTRRRPSLLPGARSDQCLSQIWLVSSVTGLTPSLPSSSTWHSSPKASSIRAENSASDNACSRLEYGRAASADVAGLPMVSTCHPAPLWRTTM